jgi:hypothetical protein
VNTAREWLDLLPWATPDERRSLLDSEHAAGLHFRALRAAGVPFAEAFTAPAALEVLAGVCAFVHGTPRELIEGRTLA